MDSIPDDLNTIAPGHLTYGISPMHGVQAEEARVPAGVARNPSTGDPHRQA